MKKILVYYFHGTKFDDVSLEHKQEFDYSTEKRNEIIDEILNAGYNVLLQQTREEGEPDGTKSKLVIFIDKYRFQQR